MTDTFTWKSEATLTGGGEFIVNKAKFGDGYSQRVPDGLNNERQTWSVVVSGYEPYVAAALAFIRAKRGAEKFYWTPPLGERSLWTCSSYTPTLQGSGHFTLTLEFVQEFEP